MKILIYGCDGMLGHKLCQVLAKEFEVHGTTRTTVADKPYAALFKDSGVTVHEGIDVAMVDSDTYAVKTLVSPDVVINCTGILKGFHPLAENNIPCMQVNGLFPHMMATNTGAAGQRFITFSTDCVFDGVKKFEFDYTEEDIPDSPSLYGRTKHMGEVHRENTLTLRTSFIGREIKSFKMLLEWFIAQSGKQVDGFARAVWSGVTNQYLADLLVSIIKDHQDLHGLYHVTSAQPVDKHLLLYYLKEAYNLDIAINRDERFLPDKVCNRSMSGIKLARALNITLPNHQDLTRKLAEDTTPYEDWR